MADLPLFASARSTVRSVDFGHVMVLVDYRDGQVRCLLPAAAAHWVNAARTGRLDTMPAALSRALITGGLLTPAVAPVPWRKVVAASTPKASWGGIEHQAGLQRPPRTSLPATLAATAALALVFAVKHAGPSGKAMLRITRLIAAAASTSRWPATPAEALAAVHAARAAAWWSPGRTACLEESAAVVVLLAAQRRRVTWCHGIAADPVRLHAWVQTDDKSPVAEPSSIRAYTPALTLGARHQRP
ncbi:lasso peptide biosynthesis B2 protein [Streptomyces sp. NPDC055089]